MVNLRGEPLPVVDGGALMRGRTTRVCRHLLVLEQGGRRIGIVVGRVSGIERHVSTAPPPDPDSPRPQAEFVTWVGHRARALGLIDPDALFASAAAVLNEDSPTRDASRQIGEVTCDDAF